MYYPNIRDILKEELPGFSAERTKTQHLIMKMLFLPHRDWEDRSKVIIPKETVVDDWGHCMKTFHSVNKRYGLYSLTDASRYFTANDSAYARWEATNETRRILEAVYEDTRPITIARRPVEQRQHTKTGQLKHEHGLPKKGQTRKVGGMNVQATPKINMETLERFIDEFRDSKDPSRMARSLESAYQLYRMGNNSNLGWGYVPMDYAQYNGGRTYGYGLKLQNAPREVRTAALDGYWDYDMENVHYTILSHFGGFPAINQYLNDKHKVREELSNYLGVSEEQAKRCLISLIYGVTRGTDQRYCAIPRILGGAPKTNDFWCHPFINELSKDVDNAGKEFLGTEKVDYKALSGKLQRIESKMLAIICEGHDVVVPMHDGMVLDVDMDTNEMESMVKQRLGYDISITRKGISYGDITCIR